MAKVTRLSWMRKEMGLSQTEVETTLRIPHVFYSLMEQGRLTSPHDFMAHKLEGYFNKPIQELLEMIEVDFEEPSFPPAPKLTPKEVASKGGTTTFLKYGRKYMQELAKKGAAKTKEMKNKEKEHK